MITTLTISQILVHYDFPEIFVAHDKEAFFVVQNVW